MSIVPVQEIYDFLGDDDSATTTPVIAYMHDAAEAWVKKYCNRDFESTTYKDRYHGTGSRRLVLRNYPVISVERLSLWPIDVMRVTNTALTTHASVSVTTTGISLTKDGTTDSTITFALYTTMTSVVDAINALAGDWSAVMQSSTYNSYLSSELIPRYGLYCLRSFWAYLQMPYFSEMDFDVDADAGIISLFRYLIEPDPTFMKEIVTPESVGFPRGTRNIFVYYTAGYAEADMPEDLKMAIKIIVKSLYESKEESYFGRSSFSTGEVSSSFSPEAVPKEALIILNQYKRYGRDYSAF